MTKAGLRWPLIGALWVAELTASFETAMILAALKALIAEFGDPAKVGWLITGYLIVGAAVAAIVGRLGDLYGRRRVLLIVLAIGAGGSLISALSTSFAMLLAGRVIQGATGAILPLCIGLVRENVSSERTPVTIGLMISGASLGTATGLVLGGFIVDTWSWHGVFFASAAFCATALAAVALLVPRSPRAAPAGPTDWLSGLLFAPGVTLVLLYITIGPRWGWLHPGALAALVGGVTLTTWWWRQSLRSATPLISVRAFSDRTVAVGGAVTALVAMSTLQITVFFSLLLQAPKWTAAGLGLSATVAGLAKLPSNISSTFAAPLGGWLAGRGGGRVAMIVGGLLTASGWGLVLIDASSVAIVVAELVVISFGATMLFAVAPTIIAQASPPDRVSEIAGLVTVIRQLFLGIGAQLVTTLLAVETVARGAERYPSPFAYQLTVAAIIAVSLLATLLCLALPTGRSSHSGQSR
ncbi:MAG: MFS transporter [Novosphingobium sp.]|nr:MFS transporter [Novosphingobium sp.]